MKVKVDSLREKNRWAWVLGACLAVGALALPAAAPEADVRRDATVEVVEKVMPSVVNIAVETVTERSDPYYQMLRKYYNWPKEQRQLFSAGSGVIIDEAGFLITNFHVVQEATRVQVKLSNGEVYDARKCVFTTQRDIALLQIILPENKKSQKFQAMKFALDDDLLLGESVIAFGNPYGLGGSVTRGILSSKNRRLSSGNEPLDVPDWLQTDADINPGNSGGPLINLRGELIGINVAVHREDQGMGVSFAIPVRQINAALSEFFTPEAANSYWFGARAGAFNAPLTVNFVQPRSPAEKAGLRVGQKIVSVNGAAPRNLAEFQSRVTERKDTDQLATLQVEDEGERRSLKVQLVAFDDLNRQRLGLVLRNITTQTAPELGVRPGEALVIESVERGSPADRLNLRPGFLISALDDRKTRDVINAANIISSKTAGERMKVSFHVPPRFGNRYGNYQSTVTLR